MEGNENYAENGFSLEKYKDLVNRAGESFELESGDKLLLRGCLVDVSGLPLEHQVEAALLTYLRTYN